MAFIFQGNPERFDIDDYLARYPFIYWSAPVLQNEMKIGDQAIIWRSGGSAGAIAIGRISERPNEIRTIQYPEALGDDLWRAEIDEPSVVKVGISISEVRLTEDDGMLTRRFLREDPVIQQNRIITNPQGTVFRLSSEETTRFLALWQDPTAGEASQVVAYATEGKSRLRRHYSRERSQYLIREKRKEYISRHGELGCEACGLSEGKKYPADFGTSFIEVHHKKPLSETTDLVKTTLDDLVVLCANCHRTIHSTNETEENFAKLMAFYKRSI